MRIFSLKTCFIGLCAMTCGRAFFRYAPLVKSAYKKQYVRHDWDGVKDTYNFSKMINLIERSMVLLDGDVCDNNYLNAHINELIHERSSLMQFIQDLRGSSVGGVPIRKMHSLQYYLDVLDSYIVRLQYKLY